MHMLLTVSVMIEGSAGKIIMVVVTNLSFNLFLLIIITGTHQPEIIFHGFVLINYFKKNKDICYGRKK